MHMLKHVTIDVEQPPTAIDFCVHIHVEAFKPFTVSSNLSAHTNTDESRMCTTLVFVTNRVFNNYTKYKTEWVCQNFKLIKLMFWGCSSKWVRCMGHDVLVSFVHCMIAHIHTIAIVFGPSVWRNAFSHRIKLTTKDDSLTHHQHQQWQRWRNHWDKLK